MLRTTVLTSNRPKSASALPGSYVCVEELEINVREYNMYANTISSMWGYVSRDEVCIYPPPRYVEAFREEIQTQAFGGEGNTQGHNTRNAIRVVEGEVISWYSSKIFPNHENLFCFIISMITHKLGMYDV